MFTSSSNSNDVIDTELVRKAKKTCDKITESIYVAANEPNLACFRIQEHIHRTAPILIDKKIEMARNESTLKGILYDIEYSKDSIESLKRSKDHFDLVYRLAKDSIYFKQQTDYDANVRRRVQEKLNRQKREQHKQEQSSSLSDNRRIQFSGQSSSISLNKTSNRFNRFSTSFDFSNSIPMVASSVSADIKSLINQFTSKDSTVKDNDKPKEPLYTIEKTVTASKSLHVLSENLDEDNS